ncbi:hypothetical protein [Actinoplanes sp. NPDC049681]|uniref:hypothetical protein n=1 Tax=Actinoplanes sp. NPDC049681 TaxID=3363905 RepID=UPI00378ADC09
MRLLPALVGAALATVLAAPAGAAAHGHGGPLVGTDKGIVQGVRAGEWRASWSSGTPPRPWGARR